MSETKRTRKTPEEMVAELEAKLVLAKERAEAKVQRINDAYSVFNEATVVVAQAVSEADFDVDAFQEASRHLVRSYKNLSKLRD